VILKVGNCNQDWNTTMAGYLKVFLYLCLGEITVHLTKFPIPGAIVGLTLMLIDFSVNRTADRSVAQIFDGVSKHLTILFVPAGAGVVAHGTTLTDGLPIIASAVIGGTMTTLVVTAFCFSVLYSNQSVARPTAKETQNEPSLCHDPVD
jgi:holin-like protein